MAATDMQTARTRARAQIHADVDVQPTPDPQAASTTATKSRSSRSSRTSGRPVWRERPVFGYQLIKAVIIGVVSLAIAIPLLIVVSTSLAGDQQIIASGGYVLWPTHPTLKSYVTLFSGGLVFRAVGVSIVVTVVGTLIALFVTITMAYATSRPVLFGRPALLLVLFTLLFAPGLIPMYLMVRQLGLLDSLWSLILPGVFGAFNFVVLRAFFSSIPKELIESAQIDGASDFTILRRIVLPLSKAVVAVVGLFYAVGFWNAFFNAQLYLNDTGKWPIQAVLRSYVLQGTSLTADQLGVQQLPPPQSMQMAIVVVALVPIALVFPFLQKHFTKGVITGAIKG